MFRSLKDKLLMSASRMPTDRRGNVAMMFALMAVPMTALITASLEYSMAASTRVSVQAAVDSAVLAAGRKDIRTEDREAHAKQKFEAMLPPDIRQHMTSDTFKLNIGATLISGTANISLPKKFGNFLGSGNTEIGAKATSKVAKALVRQLDVVMCIDATGSMQNTINAVKTNALSFQTSLNTQLVNRGIDPYEAMRVKVVFYRDYGGNSSGGYYTGSGSSRRWVNDPTYWGDRPPMDISTFYDLSTQTVGFSAFVSPETASGGGDIPESGLECVNEAMSSPWAQKGDVIAVGPNTGKVLEDVFPVVIVWTDAPAHPPSHARSLLNTNYPSSTYMPRTYAALQSKWDDNTVINQTNKLLIFFGNPDNYLPSYPTDDGWAKVKTWVGYFLGGSLTAGNTQMVTKIADAIAWKQKAPSLSQ